MPSKLKHARIRRAIHTTVEKLEVRRLLTAVTPSSSVLVFNSQIGSPSLSDTLTITNNGSSALTFGSNSLQIVADPNDPAHTNESAEFAVTSGALPSSLPAGQSAQITLVYTANVANTVQEALLNITDTTGSPTTTSINLRGLGTNGQFGTEEPSLANILTAFNITTNIGVTDPSNSQYPENPGSSSQEVTMQRLVKAGAGPVTFQLLASFDSSASPSVRFGYYTPGDTTDTTELFTINNADDQTVNPVAQGATSFDPGSSEFSLYSVFPGTTTPNSSLDIHYSEDQLNTQDTAHPRKVRFFPLEYSNGSPVANTYVVAVEDYDGTAYNSFTNVVGIISNVTAAPGGADGAVLGLTNLSGAPSSTSMAFNRIQNANIPPDPNGFVDDVHDSNVLQITNTGDQTLDVTSLQLSDPTDWSVSTSGPFTVAPGATHDVTITFIATTDPSHTVNETNDTTTVNGLTPTAAGGVWDGTLTIFSNDADRPQRTVSLAGYWQDQSENENEPGLQTITNLLYGYDTDISNTFEPEYPNSGSTPVYYGEEVPSAYWDTADPSQPVTVLDLAAYHNQFDTTQSPPAEPGASLNWYLQGSGNNFLFQQKPGSSQSLLPASTSASSGSASFSPSGTFGWNLDGENSLDSANTADIAAGRSGHAVRFYPVRDANGNLIPNEWLMVMDYENSTYDNSDFQDNIYLVTNMRPATQAPAPADLQGVGVAGGVQLEWAPVSDSNLIGYNVYSSSSPNGSYTKLNSSPITSTSYLDTSAADGAPTYYHISAVDTSGESVMVDATAQPLNTLSTNLVSADINSTPSGSTTIVTAGSAYTVTGGGVDIGATAADGFRYVYQQVTGDFDAEVEINSLSQNVAPNSSAGLMVRDDLDAGSPMVFSGASASDGFRFNYRETGSTLGTYNISTTTPLNYPDVWVRLVRQGDEFTTYSSTDGTTWTETGSLEMSAPNTVYLGMAVSSKNTSQTVTAQFVNYAVNSASSPTSPPVSPPVSPPPPPPPPPPPGAPATPTGFTAIAGSSGITLDWAAEANVSGYNLLTSTSATGTFTQLNSSLITGTEFLDSTETPGATIYYELVAVDSSGDLSNAATSNAVVPNSVTTQTFTGKTGFTYNDGAGHTVTLKLAGPGSGTASFVNGGSTPSSITLSGTTTATTLNITVKGGTTNVGTIADTGSLGHITAPKVLLEGDLSVAGSLASAQFAGASGGHTLTVGAGIKINQLNLGQVSDLSINSAATIALLQASSWSADGSPVFITAPAIKQLSVNGDFAAGLILDGTGSELGSTTIHGALSGEPWTLAGSAGPITVKSVAADWVGTFAAINTFSDSGDFDGSLTSGTIGTLHVGGNLTGDVTLTGGTAKDLKTLTVAGAIVGGQVRAAGSIVSVIAAALVNADVFAGVDSSVTALPTTASDFVATSAITTVVITGNKQPFAVQNSNVAAYTLGHVTFGNLNTDNGGTPFGLAAHQLTSYSRKVNGKKLTWTSHESTSLLTSSGDATVELL